MIWNSKGRRAVSSAEAIPANARVSPMITSLISIIFTLVFLAVLWWAAKKLLALVPLEEPFKTIIYVLMVVVMFLIVLWIVAALLGIAGIHVGGPLWR